MKQVFTIIAILIAFSGKAQTIEYDTTARLFYVGIDTVTWGGLKCDRLYINAYESNAATFAKVTMELRYFEGERRWFVGPAIVRIFEGLQYDSVKALGKSYYVSKIISEQGFNAQ